MLNIERKLWIYIFESYVEFDERESKPNPHNPNINKMEQFNNNDKENLVIIVLSSTTYQK